MLNIREEIELHRAREYLIALQAGGWFAALACLAFLGAWAAGLASWPLPLAVFEAVLALVFFGQARRTRHRIRDLEALED